MSETGIEVSSGASTVFDFVNPAGTMTVTVNGIPLYNATNDGDGSGLDADRFDGRDSSSYARKDGSAGNQVFNNEVRANRFRSESFSALSVQTGYARLPAMAFTVATENGNYTLDEEGYLYTDNVAVTAYAAVSFPEGSTISDLTCYHVDRSATKDFTYTYQLFRRNELNPTSSKLAAVSDKTFAADSQMRVASTNSISIPVVEIHRHDYFVKISLISTQLNPPVLLDEELRFYGCEVGYEWTDLTNS